MMPTPERKTRLDAVAIALLLICCVLWGLNQVAAKMAMTQIPPLLQAAGRSVVAAALVGVWSLLRGVPLVSRDGTLRGGVAAGLLFAAEFCCIFLGLQFTTASRMVVFIYLSPFVVALGMHFIAPLTERLRLLQWSGLLIAFAGVAWAFAEGFSSPAAGRLQWLGDTLGVSAAVLWAGTTLVIRGSRLSVAAPEKTLMYQLLLTGVLLGLLGLGFGERWPLVISLRNWVAFGFQGVVVSFFSYLLWFWLVRHYPATRLATFTLLTPVAGLVAGALVLGEPVTGRLYLAVLAVVVGIALVNRPTRPTSGSG